MKNRPNWDLYFLAQCFLVNCRSIDPNTECGAILVSKHKRPLAFGYNSPIAGSIDEEIPLTRPEKYFHMIHSEDNCLLNCYHGPEALEGSTMYITGKPCHKCLRAIIQKGIKRIVYANVQEAACQDEQDEKASALMLKHHPEVQLIELDVVDDIIKLYEQRIAYIKSKSKNGAQG